VDSGARGTAARFRPPHGEEPRPPAAHTSTARAALEPVHVGEIASRLAQLALAEPAGRVADVAGPEVLDIPQLLVTYTDSHGRRRPQLPVRLPGAIGRAYRAGENLSGPGAQRMMSSWTEFLAEHSARRPDSQLQTSE